ncbi:MAG: NUDIX domain-containing protein [Nanoarchaeota archaeon]|nr:NUDIX domain-containing protein [Nanoarchaeota archaeon]
MKYGNLSYLCVKEKVLMLEKGERDGDLNSGFYAIPGGKINESEMGISKPEGRKISVIRENSEETGLTLLKPKLLGMVLFDNSEREFPGGKKMGDFLVYIFSSDEYGGQILDNPEEGNPVWVPKKDILGLPMHEGDRLLYEWVFQDKPFSGVIYHKGNKVDFTKSFVDFF